MTKFFKQASASNRKLNAKTPAAVPLMENVEGRRMFSTYVVTTASDAGTGSLRDALNRANRHIGADVISFAIGSGAKTIQSLTGMPYISDPVTVDGTTQPGYAGKPIIELRGDVSGGYCFNLGAGGSTIKGLVINRYSSAILMVNKGGNVVKNCYLGTDLTGTVDLGNKDKGIIVQTGNNVIGGLDVNDGNVISGNGTIGVQFYLGASTNNKLLGNKIGTNAAGTAAMPNDKSGVAVYGAPGNLIGGTDTRARNLISGNKTDGIVVNVGGATGTVIQGNFIGTDVSGTKPIPNGNYGVETSQPNTLIGGAAAGARNVISGNANSGVVLWLASGSKNTVQGNYIGTDVTGKFDLGNAWRGVDVSNGSSGNLVMSNLISGNDMDGVMCYQGSANTLQGNTIGYDVTHTRALPNAANGVRFTNVTSATAIGNYVGNNGGYGFYRGGGGAVTMSANVVVNDLLFNL